MRQDPGLEDRERLEQFLEWRRADDEKRKTERRQTAGMAMVAVAVAALIMAGAWYAIHGHQRAVLTPTANRDARVAMAPRVEISPAPSVPVSRPESKRDGSDMAASSATPAEPTSAEAPPPPAVTRPRRALRSESALPRRSTRGVSEAGRVRPAPAPADPPGWRPSAPAPIVAPPAASPPDVVVSRSPEPAPSVAPPVEPPPAVVPDTLRADVPRATTGSVRSEQSTPVADPPTVALPETRTDDAAIAVRPPAAAQTAAIQSGARASVVEPPTARAAQALRSTAEVVKEWAGYIPEVRMAKAIYRWAKKQPPPDDTERAKPEIPESR